MISLTIIVPVYNCQKYIGRCLFSLVSQTNQEFELIVIDDGSSDDSYKVAVSILKKRKRTAIIQQENHGVSHTRNVGIEKAEGEYIAFVDADDVIAVDYVSKLLSVIQRDHFDFVMSGTEYQEAGICKRKIILDEEIWDKTVLRKGRIDYIDYTTSIHGKLYKKAILDEYHIRFDESMSLAEDRDFNIEYLQRINKACNTSYIGYYYTTDVTGSLSKKYYPNQMRNDIAYWNKLYSLLVVTNEADKQIHNYLSNRLFNFIIDNMVEITRYHHFLDGAKIVKDSLSFVNFDYINRHKKYITAPSWQKTFVSNNLFLYCCMHLCRSLKSIFHKNHNIAK